MLWQLMENGLEELKLLQTVLVLLTTNTVVHDEVLSKVKACSNRNMWTQNFLSESCLLLAPTIMFYYTQRL